MRSPANLTQNVTERDGHDIEMYAEAITWRPLASLNGSYGQIPIAPEGASLLSGSRNIRPKADGQQPSR